MDTLDNIIKSSGAGENQLIVVDGVMKRVSQIGSLVNRACFVVIGDITKVYILRNMVCDLFDCIVVNFLDSKIMNYEWYNGETVGYEMAEVLNNNQFKLITLEPELMEKLTDMF